MSNTIDFLKFIFCIFIIGIHTELLSGMPDKEAWFITHLLFRLGVPFFFCVSGLFLGRKIWESREGYSSVFQKYRQRMYFPFLFWGGLGLFTYAVREYNRLFVGGGIPYLIQNKKIFLAVECIRTAIFYPMGAMWFVLACIVASVIVEKVFSYKKRNVILWTIGLSGYVFALFANTYYYMIENSLLGKIVQIYLKVCVSARNGLFEGVIFLWIGIVLANERFCKEAFKRISVVWVLFMISWVTLFMEVYFAFGKHVADDSSLFISFLIMMPTGIILASRYNMRLKLPYLEMRKYSTYAYFSHSFFCEVIGLAVSGGVVKFLLVLCVTFLFFVCVEKSSNKFLHKIV